jgi:hypothetical protein
MKKGESMARDQKRGLKASFWLISKVALLWVKVADTMRGGMIKECASQRSNQFKISAASEEINFLHFAP